MNLYKGLLASFLLFTSLLHGGPLHEAAKEGNLSRAKKLVAEGASLKREDDFGGTPLVFAVQSGNLALVEFLIDSGAKIDQMTEFGFAAIHKAIQELNVEMVKLLGHKGADLMLKDENLEATPQEMVGMIQDNPDKKRAIRQYLEVYASVPAFKRPKPEVVDSKPVIEQKPILDGENQAEKVKIKIIVENKPFVQKLKDLDAQGEDVTRVMSDGGTLLITAAQAGDVKASAFLVKKGVDVNEPDEWGEYPLSHAVRSGSLELVKLLVGNGAEVNKFSGSGFAPIHEAVGKGFLGIIKYLVEVGGAKLDLKDDNDQTPLQKANLLILKPDKKLEIIEYLQSKTDKPKAPVVKPQPKPRPDPGPKPMPRVPVRPVVKKPAPKPVEPALVAPQVVKSKKIRKLEDDIAKHKKQLAGVKRKRCKKHDLICKFHKETRRAVLNFQIKNKQKRLEKLKNK